MSSIGRIREIKLRYYEECKRNLEAIINERNSQFVLNPSARNYYDNAIANARYELEKAERELKAEGKGFRF